jgi:leukotriene-A4 hydrolase
MDKVCGLTETSYLDISKIEIASKSVEWKVGDRQEPYGSPLTISLNKALSKDEEIDINVCHT